MKPSYHQLVSELLKNKSQTPHTIQFHFRDAGIAADDFPSQIEFLKVNFGFFSSFPKSLHMEEVSRIFNWINSNIASLSHSPRDEEVLVLHLNHLNTLFGIITEERYWAMFDQQKKLLDFFIQTQNIQLLIGILRFNLGLLTLRPKLTHVLYHDLSDEDMKRFYLTLHAWNIGVNLGNRSPQSFGEKFLLNELDVFDQMCLEVDSRYNTPLSLNDIPNQFQNDTLITENLIFVSLREFHNLKMEEVLARIHQRFGLVIDPQSLNAVFLHVRLGINRNLVNWETQQINKILRQNLSIISLLGITSSTLLNRFPTLIEQFMEMNLVFDTHVSRYSSMFSFNLLESHFLCEYHDPDTLPKIMFMIYQIYHTVNDPSAEEILKVKNFFQAIIEKLHFEICGNRPLDSFITNLKFPVTSEFFTELCYILGQLSMIDSKNMSLQSDNSQILELMVEIHEILISKLETDMSTHNLRVVLNINRLFLQETEKDKDFLLFDILSSSLKGFIEAFYNNRHCITRMPQIYNIIDLLFFETVEGLESYFLEPIRSLNSFKIPKMAKTLLENPLWDSGRLIELDVEFPTFSLIFNELIALFHDLINNISDVLVQGFINKFYDSGLLPCIIDRIGTKEIANEFDSLGYSLNLLSKIILHNQEAVDNNRSYFIFNEIFSKLLTKQGILNNYKRFNGGESSGAFKNFGDEVVALCNIHSRFSDVITRVLLNQIKIIKSINNELKHFVITSNSTSEFVDAIISNELVMKKYGWFGPDCISNDQIRDDLLTWERNGNNLIKLYSRFFDNVNTNLYNNIIASYKLEFPGKSFFDFILGSYSECPLYFDPPKKRKFSTLFVRVIVNSLNRPMVTEVHNYLDQTIQKVCTKLKKALQKCQPSQLSEVHSILFCRTVIPKNLDEIDMTSFTKECLSLIKNYSKLYCIVDIIQHLSNSHRTSFVPRRVLAVYASIISALTAADIALVRNGERGFRRHLTHLIESQIHEIYYQSLTKTAPLLFIQISKIFENHTEYTASNSFQYFMSNWSQLKNKDTDTDQTHPILYIGRHVAELNRLAKEETTYYSIIAIHMNLNGLNLFKKIKENVSYFNGYAEMYYMLSKIKFFSLTIPSLITCICGYISKLKLFMRKIFASRSEKNPLYARETYTMQIIEGKLSDSLSILTNFVDKFYAVTVRSKYIKHSDESLKKEVFIDRTIKAEQQASAIAIAAAMRTISVDTFECFSLREKPDEEIDIVSGKKKTKKSKPIHSETETFGRTMDVEQYEEHFIPQFTQSVPLIVSKNNLLSAFFVSLKNFFDIMFVKICEKILPTAEGTQPGFSFKEITRPIENNPLKILNLELAMLRLCKDEISTKNIEEFEYNGYANEESELDSVSPSLLDINPYNNARTKEDDQELEQAIESLTIFFFNNFIHFAKGKSVLMTLWKSYIKFKKEISPENQDKILMKLLLETKSSLKQSLEGKTSKSRIKTDFKMFLKGRDITLYILSLQTDLLEILKNVKKNQIPPEMISQLLNEQETVEEENPTENRVKSADSIPKYLIQLVHQHINGKYKRQRVQQLIRSVFMLLEKSLLTIEEKLAAVECIQLVYAFHTTKQNTKEKLLLLHPKLVSSLLDLLCALFNNDEAFTEKIYTLNKLEVIKTLLRIQIDKNQLPSTMLEIYNKFAILSEILIRQTSVINMLIECEIKNFLFRAENKSVKLSIFSMVFSKTFSKLEKTVMKITHSICEIFNDEQDNEKIKLQANQEFTMNPSDIRGPASEFFSLLIGDALFKLQKVSQTQEHVYLIDHLKVCETLFLQILPRYPIFYRSVLSKHKTPFLVYFVERYIEIHPSYFQFIAPIFFDYAPLIRDGEGEVVSISVHVRNELILRIIQLIESKCSEVLNNLHFLKQINVTPEQYSEYRTAVDEAMHILEGIFTFLLHAMRSENFNREMENRKVFDILIVQSEKVFMEASEIEGVKLPYLTKFLFMPDIVRRRQIIKTLNTAEFRMNPEKDNTAISLQVPTTFRFPIGNWCKSINKSASRAFNLTYTLDISYEPLITKIRTTKKSGFETFHRQIQRRSGRMSNRHGDHQQGFRTITNEEAAELGLDQELLVEEIHHRHGHDDDDEEEEGDMDDESESEESMRRGMVQTNFRFTVDGEEHANFNQIIPEAAVRELNNPTELISLLNNTLRTFSTGHPNRNSFLRMRPIENDMPPGFDIPPPVPQPEILDENRTIMEHSIEEEHEEEAMEQEFNEENEEDEENEVIEEEDESEELSENTEEERLSEDDGEDDGSIIEDEEMDFEELNMASEDEYDEDDNHIDFMEMDNGEIDIMVEMNSQQSAGTFGAGRNPIEIVPLEDNTICPSVPKLYMQYPFAVPLNLHNKSYIYYHDLALENYKAILEKEYLPHSKPNHQACFARLSKEFADFKNGFLNEQKVTHVSYGRATGSSMDEVHQFLNPRDIRERRHGILEGQNNSFPSFRNPFSGMSRNTFRGMHGEGSAEVPFLGELRRLFNREEPQRLRPGPVPPVNTQVQTPGNIQSNPNENASRHENEANELASLEAAVDQETQNLLSRREGENASDRIEDRVNSYLANSAELRSRMRRNNSEQERLAEISERLSLLRENVQMTRESLDRSRRIAPESFSSPPPTRNAQPLNPEMFPPMSMNNQINSPLRIESPVQSPTRFPDLPSPPVNFFNQNRSAFGFGENNSENRFFSRQENPEVDTGDNNALPNIQASNPEVIEAIIESQIQREEAVFSEAVREEEPREIPEEADETRINNENIPFVFEEYGLPANFLEIAGIDATFFEALPDDTRLDLVSNVALDIGLLQPGQELRRVVRSPVAPNLQPEEVNSPIRRRVSGESESHHEMQLHQDNNVTFVESLPIDLRHEILMTCPNEFLMSLPENLQEEAQNLRENMDVNDFMQVHDEGQVPPNANVPTNRIKMGIQKNKQRDLIKKYLNSGSANSTMYESTEEMMDKIFVLIRTSVFKLENLPLSYLSSVLFNTDRQSYFYNKLLDEIETSPMGVKIRLLTVLEVLTYSNFLFFHSKPNLIRILALVKKCNGQEQLLYKLTRILNHLIKTSLKFQDNKEDCNILITEQDLEAITSILSARNPSLFESLSIILFMLSFNVDNLKLIIESLQENVSKMALTLNFKFEDILKLEKGDNVEGYLNKIAFELSERYATQNGILKVFKLLEHLFQQSFSLNFDDNNKEGEKLNDQTKREEKNTRFNEIKKQVVESFASYFKQIPIKLLFLNMFKILNIFEPHVEKLVEKRKTAKPVFTKLSPLIESFFIIYKLLCDEEVLRSIKANLHVRDTVIADVQMAAFHEQFEESDNECASPLRGESQKKSNDDHSRLVEYMNNLTIESLFLKGIKSNKDIFNYLLAQVQKISNSALSVIVRHTPRFVNFEIKRKYFQSTVQTLRTSNPLRIIIKRDNLFHDSFQQLNSKSTIQLRGKLVVKFDNEPGIDAGGVQREWYQELSKEIFNPNYALFIPAAHGYAYQPSPFSTINREHLSYFKFIGKMFGRALLDGNLMDAHFTRSFYKHMTGAPLNYLDLEDYDADYFRTIKWILENDVDNLGLDFSYERDNFGVKQVIDLKKDGRKIAVDNQNKGEYVRLICEQKMTEEIRSQIKNFLEGLNTVIPAHHIKMFDCKELELMISGMPEIDLEDLKLNTEYNGFTDKSPLIINFWEVLREFDESMRAGFLQFVTGTSKVPMDGFVSLIGMGGVHRFNIVRVPDPSKLPTSHTCMNQLDLPDYETKQELKDKLSKAILYGKEGFGFG